MLSDRKSREQDNTSIREFERVVMHSRRLRMDLSEYRRLVSVLLPAPKTARRYGDLVQKSKFRSGQKTHGDCGVFRCTKTPRSRAETADREFVADLSRTGRYTFKAVVAHVQVPRWPRRSAQRGKHSLGCYKSA